MSLERVKNAVRGTALENQIIPLKHTGATVQLAADAVGCSTDEIAKTMSFLVDEQPILIVVSGDARIDNRKYRNYFHKKAKMIPFEDVESLIGHAVGGVCPFGVNDNVEIYLDESIRKHEVLYPAAGDEDYVLRTPVDQFEKLTGYKAYIDVTKTEEAD